MSGAGRPGALRLHAASERCALGTPLILRPDESGWDQEQQNKSMLADASRRLQKKTFINTDLQVCVLK